MHVIGHYDKCEEEKGGFGSLIVESFKNDFAFLFGQSPLISRNVCGHKEDSIAIYDSSNSCHRRILARKSFVAQPGVKGWGSSRPSTVQSASTAKNSLGWAVC